ncbi:trypsin-like peptidase domain-containing protein [Spirochaetes bacterium]|uniref:Trypsin-like peptidase domain-containing protein n=1 Tax=Candidatus Scatousia excrementipullorum TaxID=2840936 RepID=A0A9D9GXC5_9BACT|nr:trypsin-like peptidase domain-containing protein [Candidatus Scatousia excrementipullorum]
MNYLRIFLVFAAISTNMLVISPVFSADYANDEQINITVYESINPAIVSIEADIDDGVSAGTGCIVTSDGLILTGSHVIEGGHNIEVTTYNGQVYKAQIVSKMGKNKDLALIKITPKKPLQTIKFGDSSTCKVGQKVLAIGNPFGFSGTLTQGIISRIDYTKNKIQTDAAINPGCSGGPLLNSAGEVIGINQSIYNPDNNISNIGIGFAIPINDAKKFIQLAQIDKK